MDCVDHIGFVCAGNLEVALMMKNDKIHKGMHVVVLGLGISGRAAVRYLLGCGARVSVSDARAFSQM